MITGDVIQATADIQEARVIVIPPPPVRGPRPGRRLQDAGREPPEFGHRPAPRRGGRGAGQGQPEQRRAAGLHTFGNDTPQLYLDIDRTVARMLNVPLSNVFSTVQTALGGAYVNDFNTLGRSTRCACRAMRPSASRSRISSN